MPSTDSRPVPDSAAAAVECPECGAAVAGRFCGTCGERMLGARDHSFRAFMAEAAAHVLTFDNRLWRTLRAVLRPGLLTREYMTGRRGRYLSPVHVFLLLTVAFFLVAPRLGLLNTRLAQFERDAITARVAERIVAAGMARTGLDRADYRARFDRTLAGQRRAGILIAVPIFALVLKTLYRRRSFVVHLAFSTHAIAAILVLGFAYLLTFFLVVQHAIRPALLRLGHDLVWPLHPLVVLLAFGTPVLLFLHSALRRVHEEGGPRTAAKALLALVGLYYALIAYEHVLFFTTALTIHAAG